MQTLGITRNEAGNRYELVLGGRQVGVLDYTMDGEATVLNHIEVEERVSGQGLAARFTQAVLTELKSQNVQVIPQCPYVRGYIIKHPEWAALVPEQQRASLTA
jgi:predicted GNAT family acetyltransferase